MKILGISGHKGAGKTTVAEWLEGVKNAHECNNAHSIGFFTLAKDRYVDTMEREYLILDDQDVKDSVHPSGKTRRQMMQEYGCALRAIWPDVWVENWKNFAVCHPAITHLIAPDVRFPNEVKAIHDLGGHVIRLTRTPFPEDKHESETALDKCELATIACIAAKNMGKTLYSGVGLFDYVIDNANMTVDECNKAVLELVTEKGWV